MRIQLIRDLMAASDELTADAKAGLAAWDNDPENCHCKPSLDSIEDKLKVANAIENLLKRYGGYTKPEAEPGYVTVKTVVRVKREQVPGLFYDPEDFAVHAGKAICNALVAYEPEVIESKLQ